MTQPAEPRPVNPILVFDLAGYTALRTPSEQELFVFQWVSKLDEYLQQCVPDEPKVVQAMLELLLLTFLSLIPTAVEHSKLRLSWLASPSILAGGKGSRARQWQSGPAIPYEAMPRLSRPPRAMRDLVSRCLARLYEICSMTTLGEALDVLQAVIQAKKTKSIEKEVRISALVCVGVLFETIGSKAGFRLLSTFGDFTSLCLKLARTQSEPILIRVEAVRALDKILTGAGTAASDVMIKDIVKTLKLCMAHKSPLLATSAMRAFESLVRRTTYLTIPSPSIIEPLFTGTLLRFLSSRVVAIRRAAARLCAVLFATTCNTPISIWATSATATTSSGRGQAAGHGASAARSGLPMDLHRTNSLGPQSGGRHNSYRRSGSVAVLSHHGHPATSRFSLGAMDSISDYIHSEGQTPIVASRGPNTPSTLAGDVMSKPPTPLAPENSLTTATAAAATKTANNNASAGTASVAQLPEALRWLSSVFSRPTATREERTGVCDVYYALFLELDEEFIEANYHHILRHILLDLVAQTYLNALQAASPDGSMISNTTGSLWGSPPAMEAAMRACRYIAGWLLRVPIAQHLLSRHGKLQAAKVLWEEWLMGSFAIIDDHAGSGLIRPLLPGIGKRLPRDATKRAWEQVLLVVMAEWRALVEDLGEDAAALFLRPAATSPTAAEAADEWDAGAVCLFEPFLSSGCEPVRVSGAACLGAWVKTQPSALAPTVQLLYERLQSFLVQSSKAGERLPWELLCRCLGYAQGLAAVITVAAARHPLHVAIDELLDIHCAAVMLLNDVHSLTEPAPFGASEDPLNLAASGADPANLGARLGVVPVSRNAMETPPHDHGPSHDNGVSRQPIALKNLRMHIGWTLLTAVTSLGPAFNVYDAKSRWRSLWRAVLMPLGSEEQHPQPTQAPAAPSGLTTCNTAWPERVHMLQSKVLALLHIETFIQHHASPRPSDNVGGQAGRMDAETVSFIATCLRHALIFADDWLLMPPAQAMLSTTDISDPVPSLACAQSPLVSHIVLRRMVIECLLTMPDVPEVASMYPTASKLLCEVLSSTGNLVELYRDRQSVVARVASPAGGRHTWYPRAVLHVFRQGQWGYEDEAGKCSLFDQLISTQTELAGEQASHSNTSMNMAKGLSTGIDFNSCHFTAAEFDAYPAWTEQPLGTLQALSICATSMAAGDELTEKRACHPNICRDLGQPYAPYTVLVDSAVQLFGHMFPRLTENAQLSMLERLLNNYQSLPTNSHRHAAIQTNILAALYFAMVGYQQQQQQRKTCILLSSPSSPSSSLPQPKPGSASCNIGPRTTSLLGRLVQTMLMIPSQRHRLLAGEILGLLATYSSISSQYITDLLNRLTSEAIRARDRFMRAGVAVALGALYSHSGSVLASHHLKQVIVLLHSLSRDADLVVHSWALRALAETASTAGYMFGPYARDTFLMVARLFLTESHSYPFHAEVALPSSHRALPTADNELASGRERSPGTHGADVGARSPGNVNRDIATGDASAHFHPNSPVYHAGQYEPASAGVGQGGELTHYCCDNDLDAHDARPQLGLVLNSLLSVFGPELQLDAPTRDLSLTLMRELSRPLGSTGVIFDAVVTKARDDPARQDVEMQHVIDQDARCLIPSEFMLAVQQQLIFFPLARNLNGEPFLASHLYLTLRPIIRAFHQVDGAQDSCTRMGMRDLQRVAVISLDSLVRLYGDRLSAEHATRFTNDWADVLWEVLILYNTVADRSMALAGSLALERDLLNLIRTLSGWTRSLPSSDQGDTHDLNVRQAGAIIDIATDIFTLKTRSAIPLSRLRPSMASSSGVATAAAANTRKVLTAPRLFNSRTKALGVDLLVDLLGFVGRLNAASSTELQHHPLAARVGDLIKVAYLATSSVAESPRSRLPQKGLHLLTILIDQFGDVLDPDSPDQDVSILDAYQAQILSAFMPFLNNGSDNKFVSFELRQTVITAATTFGLSKAASDPVTLSRVFKPLIIAFRESSHRITNSSGDPRHGRHLATQAGNELEIMTPQAKVVFGVNVLRAWARIFAATYYNAQNSPIIPLVFPMLTRLCGQWLDAIKDAIVLSALDYQARASPHKGQTSPADLTLASMLSNGLCLGLESMVVDVAYPTIVPAFKQLVLDVVPVLDTLLRPIEDHRKTLSLSDAAAVEDARHQIMDWLTSPVLPSSAATEADRDYNNATALFAFLAQQYLLEPHLLRASFRDRQCSAPVVLTTGLDARAWAEPGSLKWDEILCDRSCLDAVSSALQVMSAIAEHVDIGLLSELQEPVPPPGEEISRARGAAIAASTLWSRAISPILAGTQAILEGRLPAATGADDATTRRIVDGVRRAVLTLASGLFRAFANCLEPAGLESWLLLPSDVIDPTMDAFNRTIDSILSADGRMVLGDVMLIANNALESWKARANRQEMAQEPATVDDEIVIGGTVRLFVDLATRVIPEYQQYTRELIGPGLALLEDTLFSGHLKDGIASHQHLASAYRTLLKAFGGAQSRRSGTHSAGAILASRDNDLDTFEEAGSCAREASVTMGEAAASLQQSWARWCSHWLNERLAKMFGSLDHQDSPLELYRQATELMTEALVHSAYRWSPGASLLQAFIDQVLSLHTRGCTIFSEGAGSTAGPCLLEIALEAARALAKDLRRITDVDGVRLRVLRALLTNVFELTRLLLRAQDETTTSSHVGPGRRSENMLVQLTEIGELLCANANTEEGQRPAMWLALVTWISLLPKVGADSEESTLPAQAERIWVVKPLLDAILRLGEHHKAEFKPMLAALFATDEEAKHRLDTAMRWQAQQAAADNTTQAGSRGASPYQGSPANHVASSSTKPKIELKSTFGGF